MDTLTFLIVTSNYNKLTLMIYIVIFLAMILGLFSARQKKYGTAKPIKTLIVNSIISYMTILFFVEYSYVLKTTDIKIIVLGSFLVGLAADGVSNQILSIMESLNVKFLISKLLKTTISHQKPYHNKRRSKNERK